MGLCFPLSEPPVGPLPKSDTMTQVSVIRNAGICLCCGVSVRMEINSPHGEPQYFHLFFQYIGVFPPKEGEHCPVVALDGTLRLEKSYVLVVDA